VSGTAFTGTATLVRLAVRRDRVLLPVWLASVAGLTAGVVASLTALYADPRERAAGAALSAANVVSRIFDGPASGTELGAMSMVEAYLVLGILVSLMSSQAVVRHTRQEEETGRAELVGAGVVGRHARLTAALVVATGANAVVVAAVTAVLAMNGFDLAGSLAGGLSLGALGVAFAGVAAVAAQVTQTQRAANGLAMLAFGTAFLLRAAGDAFGRTGPSGVEVVSGWPSWLSPIGWGHQVRPFHQDNWDVLGLFAGLTMALVSLAFVLVNHRDVGTGMLGTRPGPAVASRGLGSPLGFAWRLQRGTLLAWTVGLVVAGAAFGAVGDSVDDFVGVSEQFEQVLRQLAPAGDLVDLYFALAMGFVGLAAAGYTVQALLRPRVEEAAGRLEPVLATAVGRARWLGGHALVAGAGTVAVLVATGLSGTIAYAWVTSDLAAGLGFLWAALAQIPAALALGGFVVVAFALWPSLSTALSWAALAVSLVMGQLGALLELPQPMLDISPFTHVPRVPAEPLTATPVVVLLAVAVALFGAGLVAFRRRDLALTA
jgi:ABC-2 type transport system permease protein